MKHLQFLSLVCMITITCFSCKKSTDSTDSGNPVNWSEELRNTLWSGTFKYVSGVNQSLQPFSLLLMDNGIITWADADGERSVGNWKVDGNQINFIFPNSTTISATLAKDKWSNLKSGIGTAISIDHIASAVRPDVSLLENSTWVGAFNGSPFTVKFNIINYVELTGISYTYYSGKYTVSLAGIRCTRDEPQFKGYYYGIFQNGNTELNSFLHFISPASDRYIYWIAKK